MMQYQLTKEQKKKQIITMIIVKDVAYVPKVCPFKAIVMKEEYKMSIRERLSGNEAVALG